MSEAETRAGGAAEGRSWRLDRTVSAAVVVALALQTGGALLWAGRAAARLEALETRLAAQAPVVERLARVEEQVAGVRAAADRIERKLDLEDARKGPRGGESGDGR